MFRTKCCLFLHSFLHGQFSFTNHIDKTVTLIQGAAKRVAEMPHSVVPGSVQRGFESQVSRLWSLVYQHHHLVGFVSVANVCDLHHFRLISHVKPTRWDAADILITAPSSHLQHWNIANLFINTAFLLLLYYNKYAKMNIIQLHFGPKYVHVICITVRNNPQ